MNEDTDDIHIARNEDAAALVSPEALETPSFVDKPSKKRKKRKVFSIKHG